VVETRMQVELEKLESQPEEEPHTLRNVVDMLMKPVTA
jgi:hypothetical protein